MDRWIGVIFFKDKTTQYYFFEADDIEEASRIFNTYVNNQDLDDNKIDFHEVVNFEEMEEIER